MRKRTPSEIKAYGDGYAEAYKEFCHLLEKNDKDKAIRKMEIFAKAVEITVETAMDEPQSDGIGNCNICKYVGLEHRCNQCVNGSQFYKVEDEPQPERSDDA